PAVNPVILRNPISADMAAMRTSLIPGLVSVLRHNLNRQQNRVRLFESGLRFVPSESGLKQEPMLAGLIYGSRSPESWANAAEQVDFYDLKGDVESLLALSGNEAEFSFLPDSNPALHPGQTAAIYRDNEWQGVIGALHPALQQQLDIPQSAYVFVVCLSELLLARIPEFNSVSKVPVVRRAFGLFVHR